MLFSTEQKTTATTFFVGEDAAGNTKLYSQSFTQRSAIGSCCNLFTAQSCPGLTVSSFHRRNLPISAVSIVKHSGISRPEEMCGV